MMRRITSIKQKYACWLAAGVIAFCAAPQLLAIPIYSSGDFKDPSLDPLAPTDLSHAWYGGFDFTGVNVLAQNFALSSAAVLDSVSLWTYDTIDDSAGTLQQIKYTIFSGTQPTGTPVADGIGTITSSAPLAGHRISDVIAPLHEGVWVIQTSFDLLVPVSLVPGPYWLALSAVTNPWNANNIAKWANANVDGGSCLLQNGSGWDTMIGSRAFVLDGQPESPTGATVPDTGPTLALLAVGLSAVGWLRARLERGDNLKLAPAASGTC